MGWAGRTESRELVSRNMQCELQPQTEAVNLSSSVLCWAWESSGCAPSRGGIHGLVSSWLRQDKSLDLECQVNVIQVPLQLIAATPFDIALQRIKGFIWNQWTKCWDRLAMPVLGAKYGGIVGKPPICWVWARPSKGYHPKERWCWEATPATEDRFISLNAKWNNL